MPRLVFVTLFCIGILTVCYTTEPPKDTALSGEYRKISADEAHEMMSTLKDFILLDVRTEAEYRSKRIDGAVLIPVSEIKNRAASELSDKNAVILVYCQSGGRSASAAKELADMGYVNVYDFGGIAGWPYGTVGSQ